MSCYFYFVLLPLGSELCRVLCYILVFCALLCWCICLSCVLRVCELLGGEWVEGLDQGLEGWYYVGVRCESGFLV